MKVHEEMAIRFIGSAGSDQVGLIDDGEKLAAALLYEQLRRDGYLISSLSDDGGGPVYRLSNKGKQSLAQLPELK